MSIEIYEQEMKQKRIRYGDSKYYEAGGDQ